MNVFCKSFVLSRFKLIIVGICILCSFTYPGNFAQANSPTSKERVAKRDFDATLDIPCAQVQGQKMSVCTAKIARGEQGDTTVVVTFSNDFARTLYFRDGRFTRGNATMSGVGTDTEWTTVDGIHLIRIDDQRFEIPAEFVLGKIIEN